MREYRVLSIVSGLDTRYSILRTLGVLGCKEAT